MKKMKEGILNLVLLLFLAMLLAGIFITSMGVVETTVGFNAR